MLACSLRYPSHECTVQQIYLYSFLLLVVLVSCFVLSFNRNIYFWRNSNIHRAYLHRKKEREKIAETTVIRRCHDERIREKLPIKIRGFKFTYILKSYGCALWFIEIIMYKPLLYIRTGCVSCSPALSLSHSRKTQFWSIHK